MRDNEVGRRFTAQALPYRYDWLVFIFLLVVSTIVLLYRFEPILYQDDWPQLVHRSVYETMRWANWDNRRPFLQIPFLLVLKLSGLNLHAFLLVLVVLNVLTAFLLGVLLFQALPAGQRHLGLAAGAISLIYPAIYTRTYLTMIHPLSSLMLVVVYALLLLQFAKSRRLPLLGLSLAVLIFSFGIYEGPLGIAMLWCIFVAYRYAEPGKLRQTLLLLLPLLVGCAFAVWRTLGYSRLGITDDYLGEITLSPPVLLARTLLGVKTMIWSWTEPIRMGLGLESNLQILFILAVGIGGIIALVGIGCKLVHRCHELPIPRLFEIRLELPLVFFAFAFLVSGFIPIILLYVPNLTGVVSRVNLFAIPGASLLAVAILSISASLVSNCQHCQKGLLYVAMIPLFLIGWTTQIQIQKDISSAWQEQKHILMNVIDKVPNFVDDTAVYFVLPGYEDRVGFANWKRTPLAPANWEVTAALQVLYNNQDLSGDILYPDLDVFSAPKLTQAGVKDFWTDEITPYERAVFFLYSGSPRRLKLMTEPEDYFSLPLELENYDPLKRIVGDEPVSAPSRRLLSDQQK